VRIFTDYQKRTVRLTPERLAHILERPEMANMDTAIQDTLAHPQIVRKSRTDDTVCLCDSFCEATVVGDKWLCVVTKYLEDDAFVITAYLTDKLKQGEQLWPSQ
jgi:hypothetical protein